MKVLHTADWHLGKRFDQMELSKEHQYFLDWLIETINNRHIDLLLIAGDIFDSGNPSNTALKQYYDFLWKVKTTCCKSVVIIGGNHDSVSTLNAPKDLLKHLQVYVVGGAPDDFKEEIIPIKNQVGATEIIVCAIPFLRDKDIRLSVSGETSAERETRIKEGIASHYRQLVSHILNFKQQNIPVIATGHLYAAGAITTDSEKDIHVGNLGQIGSEEFPDEYDYIALGHLHRPQLVNKKEHIRYSGSPVALSFSETDHAKIVLLLDFNDGILSAVEEIEVPCTRKLYRIKGDEAAVKKAIAALPDDSYELPAWVDIEVETDNYLPVIEEQLNQLLIDKHNIEYLFIRQKRINKIKNLNEQMVEALSLNQLNPKTVFQKRCESMFPSGDFTELMLTFDEAIEKMGQQDTAGETAL